jgi:very-short-patch-repair endonuclease
MKSRPPAGAHDRARALRLNMTDAERKLWQALRSRQIDGYKFRRQVPIGRFIADFACHAARLVVEIDGGQHDPDSRRESERTAFIEAEGYRVLRFWNHDVLANVEGAHAVIAEHLRQRPSGGEFTPTRPSPIKGEGQ